VAQITIAITVFPAEIPYYKNEYNERFLTDMFVETIRIDPILCVYRKWSGISEQRYQAA